MNFFESKINDHPFRLPGLYQPLHAIGVGGFGAVIAATNNLTKNTVCIKKMQVRKRANLLEQMLSELSSMRQFEKHDNLLGLEHAFVCPYSSSLDSVYLVTSKMDTDLNEILRSTQLQPDQIKFIMYQVFRGVLYLHDSHISHNDIKPANILVNSDLSVKVADFGLVMPFPDEPTSKLTYPGCAKAFDLAGTLNFLPPEVLMNSRASGGETDCWALALVFAEMLGGRISFYSDDWRELIKEMLTTLGRIDNTELFARDQKMVDWIRCQRSCRKVAWDYLLPGASQEELDLVKQMLNMNPVHRITLSDAIEHPYFANLHRNQHRLQSNIVLNRGTGWHRPEEQRCLLYQKKIFHEISKVHGN